MAAASNYLEESILNYFFRNQSVAAPTRVYIALYLNDPTDEDTGTEVSGDGYERQQITFNAPTQVGGKAVILNNSKIEFPIAGSNWGQISHWGIRTDATGGNLMARGSWAKIDNVQTGNRFTAEPGAIQVTVD